MISFSSNISAGWMQYAGREASGAPPPGATPQDAMDNARAILQLSLPTSVLIHIFLSLDPFSGDFRAAITGAPSVPYLTTPPQ